MAKDSKADLASRSGASLADLITAAHPEMLKRENDAALLTMLPELAIYNESVVTMPLEARKTTHSSAQYSCRLTEEAPSRLIGSSNSTAWPSYVFRHAWVGKGFRPF